MHTDLLQVDARRWLIVHYLQVALFPLAALAAVMLVTRVAGPAPSDRRGHPRAAQPRIAAAICRVALFIFAVTFVAFDTAAGICTGLLVSAAGAWLAWAPPGRSSAAFQSKAA